MSYRVDRIARNYHKKKKQATISTPKALSEFVFALYKSAHTRPMPLPGEPCQPFSVPHEGALVLDPCVGQGALLEPFVKSGYRGVGVDICDQGWPGTIVKNYLEVNRGELETPELVVMNPPFNVDEQTTTLIKRICKYRPLLPEIWLQKTIELFGRDVPMILFTPYGLRLNPASTSPRWKRFLSGEYPEITSIVSLPKNTFPEVLFHSEILIFNINGLKAHYFYGEKNES